MSRNTSLSLLERLKEEPEAADWRQFLDLYEPLLRSWLRRHWIQTDDVDDLVQNVMAVVIRRLSEFSHNGRPGAFRTWIKSITFNCLKEHWRGQKANPLAIGGSDAQTMLAELEDPNSQLSASWNEEHDRFVMKRLLTILKPEFEERTWLAFQRFALDGQPAADVAKQLAMSTNAVFIAKSRVLARLKQESSGLLAES